MQGQEAAQQPPFKGAVSEIAVAKIVQSTCPQDRNIAQFLEAAEHVPAVPWSR
jgi:hypothetical protein